jgi:mono/diheme cytochrome c family protein
MWTNPPGVLPVSRILALFVAVCGCSAGSIDGIPSATPTPSGSPSNGTPATGVPQTGTGAPQTGLTGAAGAIGTTGSAGAMPSAAPPASLPGSTGTLASVYPESVLCPPPSTAPQGATVGLSSGFASQCAGCHGPAGLGQGQFPSLRNVATADAFVSTVRMGRNLMPKFTTDAVSDARLQADFAALKGIGDPTAAADPDCGPGVADLPVATEQQLSDRITRGMAVFRKEGPKGACAGCHSAGAIDLAFIGFTDATILRRAVPNVGTDDAQTVVDLIHALRQRYKIDRPLHPRKFRFMQPGNEVLPEMVDPGAAAPAADNYGAHDDARDRAFGHYLQDNVKLLLLGDKITTLEQAKAAQDQLLKLDLRKLQVGVPIERWTEDGFNGPASNVPTEWIPMLARHPAPAHTADAYALVDAYLADPSDANLWRFYDQIQTVTVGDPADLAARWSLRKYLAVQVASHMLLHRTQNLPDLYVGAPSADPQAQRLTAIAHNPFWSIGDSIRTNPLNCNQPAPCTTFPAAINMTFAAGDAARSRQTYEDKMSWFWLGFTVDPALVISEDDLGTVTSDYFQATSQQYYKVHNAFIVAAIATAKANAKPYLDMKGIALQGHGMWASPRPFGVFKNNEREIHHPAATDSRFAIHERLWANTFRMFLYLMNDELGQTNKVFDRAYTLENANWIYHWFSVATGVEVGQAHPELDAVVTQLRQRLAMATEITTVKAVATAKGDFPMPVDLP